MWVLLSTLLVVQAVSAIRRDIQCCNKQTSGFRQCRNACSKFVAETDVTIRFRMLKELPKDCPGHLTHLWRCLNSTNPASYTINQYVSSKMPNQAGLCCLLTTKPKCRKDCLNGIVTSLNVSCAPSNDQYHPSLISCVHRHEVTKQCCRDASKSCIKACKLLFASEKVPRQNMKRKFQNHCSKYKKVLKCVEKNLGSIETKRGIANQLHCCAKARSNGCDKRCRKELLSSKNNKSLMAGITAACKGPFELFENNDMWTCFLSSQPVKPSSIPPNESANIPGPYKDIDGGKLQCCSKAVTTTCWTLCSDMYRSSLGVPNNYQQFDMQCSYNPKEAALMNCLADVTKPCQLGCSGLNFCTNFNNRHTELFRSCDANSDMYAKTHMQQWHEGIIKVPGIPIVVQDIKKCLPDTWKAIACLLQIKPCSLKSHRSTICKSDCIHILQKCGNSSRYANKKAVENVCNQLSPSETNCISITKYLKPSKYKDVTDEVTHPCNPNPCPKSKICNIERTCYAASLDGCEPHSCSLGCRLGDASSFLVQTRQYAIMPVHKTSDGCFKLCYCKANGQLDQCTRVNCMSRDSCFVKAQNKTWDHGTHFMVDCNYCACFAGELMCTRRKCLEPVTLNTEQGRPKRNHTPLHTGLPCGCPAEYHPVCTTNGHTHPSPCIARCAGFKDKQMQEGNCESIDPCKKNHCKKGQRCLINRRTCLSLNKPCDQYVCRDKHCKNIHIVEPACDTEGRQHPNQCSLHLSGRKIAYKGFCKPHCRNNPVCGINGETYNSQCAALSARVLVDYKGSCKAIGHGPGFGSDGRCDNVKCPSIVPSNCVGVYPPGSCCPQCAAQVRILLSQAQLYTNSESLSGHSFSQPTLDDLLTALRRHVTTTECDLFGYQSIEGDIVILIKAITNKPTTLQIEACSLEAQRIETLINTATPSFTSHFILSTLKFADTQTPSLSAQVQGSSRHLMSVEHLIIALIHTYLVIKWIVSS